MTIFLLFFNKVNTHTAALANIERRKPCNGSPIAPSWRSHIRAPHYVGAKRGYPVFLALALFRVGACFLAGMTERHLPEPWLHP